MLVYKIFKSPNKLHIMKKYRFLWIYIWTHRAIEMKFTRKYKISKQITHCSDFNLETVEVLNEMKWMKGDHEGKTGLLLSVANVIQSMSFWLDKQIWWSVRLLHCWRIKRNIVLCEVLVIFYIIFLWMTHQIEYYTSNTSLNLQDRGTMFSCFQSNCLSKTVKTFPNSYKKHF